MAHLVVRFQAYEACIDLVPFVTATVYSYVQLLHGVWKTVSLILLTIDGFRTFPLP